MKNLLAVIVCVMVAMSGLKAQTTPAAPASGASISVNKEVHDYGEIKQGADPYCEFIVKNTGTAPLIIANAKGSCGCTVPEWSHEPVLPGKTTVIKVRYDTQRVGLINKSVTITSNADNEPNLILRIKGNVIAVNQGTTPGNQSPAGAPAQKSN